MYSSGRWPPRMVWQCLSKYLQVDHSPDQLYKSCHRCQRYHRGTAVCRNNMHKILTIILYNVIYMLYNIIMVNKPHQNTCHKTKHSRNDWTNVMISSLCLDDIYDRGIHAESPPSLSRKPSPESSTPQSRTLWSAWLFCDGAAPVERPARQSASHRLIRTFNV